MSPDPSKITFIIARFHPYHGGAEQNCLRLAQAAAASGWQVKVVTTTDSPFKQKLPRSERLGKIDIVRLPNWFAGQLNLGFYPRLLLVLWRDDAEIIHVENGPGFVWRDICLWLKRIKTRKVKLITTPHGPFLATPDTHTGIKRALAQIAKVIMIPYLRLVWAPLWDAVIAVNPKQREWLQHDYGIPQSKIHLVPNGVDAASIIPSLDHRAWSPVPDVERSLAQQAAREFQFDHVTSSDLARVSQILSVRLGQRDATKMPLVISFLGRVSRYKGVQDVLQALASLPASLNVHFVIMGKLFYPDLLTLVRQLGLERKVTFLDSPSDQIKDFILQSISQVHVLPSKWEATGIVLLEAMAKGNVIVTTTGNEAAEMLIESGKNGFIYNYGDINQLQGFLQQMAVGERLRTQMQQYNLQKAKTLTWEAAGAKYLTLLGDLKG